MLHYAKGDDVWFSGWSFLAEGRPTTLMDLESTWLKGHPGMRILLGDDGHAVLELKWLTKPVYRQLPAVRRPVPTGQWVHLKAHFRLSEQDVFVNVIGGLKIGEPAADLAIALSIASSMKDTAVKADTVLIGEVGLSGELRMVSQMPSRLQEAAKLGFKTAIVPKRLRKGEPWPKDIKIIEARTLRKAMGHALVGK